MDLSATNVSDFLKAMGNKPNGEIILVIEALKSSNTSSSRKQSVLKEIGVQVGVEKGGAIGKLLMPKIDVGFNYHNDWEDSYESLSAQWNASKAMLIIRWSGNQGQEGEGINRLHSAVAKSDVNWVKNLLTSDEWVKTLCSNFSPLQLARDIGNQEIITMLEEYQTKHGKEKKALASPPLHAETEMPGSTSDRKIGIIDSNFTAAMESHAIGCAIKALNKFGDEGIQEVAKYISLEFCSAYKEGNWSCIVSPCAFGCWTFRKQEIDFTIGKLEILLFQTPKP